MLKQSASALSDRESLESVLFAAESSKYRGFFDSRLHWSKAAEQGLEVHLIPGDHNMMVQEPHVRHFAAALKGCLERAGQEKQQAGAAVAAG